MLVSLGCASPTAQHYPGYKERAESRVLDDVRISAAALSAEESAAVYGAPLAYRQIQPVWVKIENKSRDTYWLMFSGLDPNFIPASEAAGAMSIGKESAHAADLDRRFRQLAFTNPVPAGQTVSGFVLTNLTIVYGEQVVFVGQVGRPVGGRFVKKADEEQLHPDVYEVRNNLVQAFLYSGGLEKFVFAAGVGATLDESIASPGKVRYRTDGLRAVLLFATRPLFFADVDVLDWEPLPRAAAPHHD